MNKTNIEWCDFTWNPITGCKRGCYYCYAKRIHDRFYKYPFSDIIFHPDRIREPEKVKTPSVIFVGSMSDIEYWDKRQTQIIVNNCEVFSWHTFMFLSKNPRSYRGIKWPPNTMQGFTATRRDDIGTDYELSLMCQFPRPFLSIEPILGSFNYSNVYQIFEKIIVGAMTGHKATVPENEWIQSVKDFFPREKIFWKSNIKKYLK